MSLGKDSNGFRLKAWSCKDVDGSTPPSQLRAIDCFAGKQSSAEINQVAVHSAWPQIVYALGLATGEVLLIRADTGKISAYLTSLPYFCTTTFEHLPLPEASASQTHPLQVFGGLKAYEKAKSLLSSSHCTQVLISQGLAAGRDKVVRTALSAQLENSNLQGITGLAFGGGHLIPSIESDLPL